MIEVEELEARIEEIERVNLEWFDDTDEDIYIHSPISIVDLHQSKMSPEQAEEILKNCGILDENGEIVEAFKDILVKRKP